MARFSSEEPPPFPASMSALRAAMLAFVVCLLAGGSQAQEPAMTNMTAAAEQMMMMEQMAVEQIGATKRADVAADGPAESAGDSAGETMVDGSAETAGPTLKPTERFRRLIPYMTFYFAQQGLAQRPRYQQYEGQLQTPVLAPQYQGNLAVPAGYILRPKSQPVSSGGGNGDGGGALGQIPQPFRPAPELLTPSSTPPPPQPRPFSLPYADDPLLYSPQPSAQLPPPPPPPPPPRPILPAPPPPPLTPEQRTAALFRLLVLLQQSRRESQGAPFAPGSVSALAQTLALLQAAQTLPGEPPGAVAKLLAQRLLLRQQHAPLQQPAPLQLPAPPPPPPPPPPQPPRAPIAPLYGARTHALGHGTKAPLLRFQVTTLAPDSSPDLLYNTVSPSPAPAPKPTPTPSPPPPRPTPLLPVVDDDVQNYLTPIRIAHVEVSPNGQDVNSPFQLTTVKPVPPKPPKPPKRPSPPAPPTPPPALRPYGYAPKAPSAAPAPSLLGRVTFTQSYPDPDAEGGTPGRPGIDYPTLATIPPTQFDCKGQRYKGFFGDPETKCQVWHYCDLNGGQASFLCPNGTIFSQVALTCDWWFNVRCASTPQLYVLNERLYKYILPVMPSFPEDFSGPLVDQYLTVKFREQEQKTKAKAKGAKVSSTTAKPPTVASSAQPTQNTLQDIEDS